jgi:hypothetical protein
VGIPKIVITATKPVNPSIFVLQSGVNPAADATIFQQSEIRAFKPESSSGTLANSAGLNRFQAGG